MNFVLKITILLLVASVSLYGCSKDKEVESPAQNERLVDVYQTTPEPNETPMLTAEQIAKAVNTEVGPSDLVVATTDEEVVEVIMQDELIPVEEVCQDENLPAQVDGDRSILYICPEKDWRSESCIKVDVSHCMDSESFCRCVYGDQIEKTAFRRHDTWDSMGDNDFTYFIKK